MRTIYLVIFCFTLSLFSCDPGTEKSSTKKSNGEPKKDALELLSDEIIENPNDQNLYIKRALIYKKKQLIDLGLKDVNRALAIDGSVSYFHTVKGDLYFTKGDLRESRLAFEDAIQYDESNTDALVKLGEVNFYLRRYEDALRYINDALRQDDQLSQAYFLKGYVYKEIGDTLLAASSFQTATEVDPDNFEAYMELGVLYAASEDPIALDYYETAIQINPNSAEALYNKGIFLQSLGEFEEALSVYQELVNAEGENFLGYYNSGYIHLTEYLDYEIAQAYFDSVLMIQPAYADALYNKGLCSEEMGRYGEAEGIYKQVLSIDPQYTLAAQGLERVLYK